LHCCVVFSLGFSSGKYLHTRAIPSHITLPRVQYYIHICVSVAIGSHTQRYNYQLRLLHVQWYILCRAVACSLKMECKCYLHVGLWKEENRVQTLAEILERALHVLHSYQYTLAILLQHLSTILHMVSLKCTIFPVPWVLTLKTSPNCPSSHPLQICDSNHIHSLTGSQ